MSDSNSVYPEAAEGRNKWIRERRGPKNELSQRRPSNFLRETEPDGAGGEVSISTIFLVNKECPWTCLMCDLWENTLDRTPPPGAIPEQIEFALGQLPPSDWIKLYNAGSFFDPAAIPFEDYRRVAELCAPFERIIVESHPRLIGDATLRFQSLLKGRLEVALGLETACEKTLARLNKGMTTGDFEKAAKFLKAADIDLRVFILVKPPFQNDEEAAEQARRSLDFAFDCGASVCALIPTRGGNGAMEALEAAGEFSPPDVKALESASEYGVGLGRGRVFADLWDADRFAAACPACKQARVERIGEMNRRQAMAEKINCGACGSEGKG